MTPVLMRKETNFTDCEVAALATATGKTYEHVYAAECRKELPGGLNDPVWGNPETLYLTLIRLGFWKRNVTWSMIQAGDIVNGKTIILVHNPEHPYLKQHYIVAERVVPTGLWAYWGDRETPRFKPWPEMKRLFLDGAPNCAFTVINDTAWNRFRRWLGWGKYY